MRIKKIRTLEINFTEARFGGEILDSDVNLRKEFRYVQVWTQWDVRQPQYKHHEVALTLYLAQALFSKKLLLCVPHVQHAFCFSSIDQSNLEFVFAVDVVSAEDQYSELHRFLSFVDLATLPLFSIWRHCQQSSPRNEK